MKSFGRIVGWVLIFLATCSLAYEIVVFAETGRYMTVALGQVIYDLWPSLLPNLQAGVQRNIHPVLWDPIILSILLLPCWLVFGVPGLVLVILLRSKKRKPMFRT